MKRQKTVEVYTCDCCGAEIDDKANASITVRCNGEIYYEWWAKGDYCERCADMLVSAIIDAIPVPERYEDKFRDHDARWRRPEPCEGDGCGLLEREGKR